MASVLASIPVQAPGGRRVCVTRKSRSNSVVRPKSTKVRASPDQSGEADPPPEGFSDRKNLGKTYFEGFVKSGLGETDDVQVEGRDTITASVKLGVQATVVLAAMTLGFMASNGLL